MFSLLSYSERSPDLTDVINLTGKLPFNENPDTEVQTDQAPGMTEVVVPVFAGILSALRRVIARHVSLKVSASIYVKLYTRYMLIIIQIPVVLMVMTNDPAQHLIVCILIP